jgi:hypothetical protein
MTIVPPCHRCKSIHCTEIARFHCTPIARHNNRKAQAFVLNSRVPFVNVPRTHSITRTSYIEEDTRWNMHRSISVGLGRFHPLLGIRGWPETICRPARN